MRCTVRSPSLNVPACESVVMGKSFFRLCVGGRPRDLGLFEAPIAPFHESTDDRLYRHAVFRGRIAHAAPRIVVYRARDEAIALQLTQLCRECLVRNVVAATLKVAEAARLL